MVIREKEKESPGTEREIFLFSVQKLCEEDVNKFSKLSVRVLRAVTIQLLFCFCFQQSHQVCLLSILGLSLCRFICLYRNVYLTLWKAADTSEASALAHLSFYWLRGFHWTWILQNNPGFQGGWMVAERKCSHTHISLVES